MNLTGVNLTGLVFGLGAIGPFASRVFLPAFLTALMLRFGVRVPHLGQLGLLGHVHHQPAWFTSDAALVVLGLLAAIETFGQKVAEVRHLLHEFDLYLKPALALLTTLGVMDATDAGFVLQSARQAGVAVGLVPLAVAVATWRVARARRPVASAIFAYLKGTHLDLLLNLAEDAWAFLGPLVLVLFPVVMLALTAAVVACLFAVKVQLARRERAARLACPQCGTRVYPCAVACPSCRRPVDQPAAVGFLGLSKPYAAADPAAQPYNLAARQRCPVCATRRRPGHPRQPCPACHDASLGAPPFAAAYAAHVARHLPNVLVVTFAIGLIPVVGLVAGSVYYRAVLVLPFAQYLPSGRRFLLGCGVQALFLVLAVCQVIPFLGGFAVPAMALISFGAYRQAYLNAIARPEDDGPAALPALAT